MLRVNFHTFKQDDEDELEKKVQYIVVDSDSMPDSDYEFEGIWLIHLDYEYKIPKFIQITHASEQNQTVNVFDLISDYLPMVGFTKTDDLKKQFEITIPGEKNDDLQDFIQVHLKVKPNSVYKDDYVYINCKIDEKLDIPVEINAKSTQPSGVSVEQKDSHEIKLVKMKINEEIDSKVFNFEMPEDFEEPDIIPLNDNDDN